MTATRPRPAHVADAAAMASLHAQAISAGFLSLLGTDLLRRLYSRVVRSEHAFAYVTTGEVTTGEVTTGEVTGFIAVALSTSQLYREFIAHDGLRAAPKAAPALLRHPARVVETLRHGLGGGGGHRPGAEVLSLAVAATARGQGAGHTLVATALAELRRRGVTAAHVVTAADNDAAHRTYLGCGFRRSTAIEVHRGTVQELLVWR